MVKKRGGSERRLLEIHLAKKKIRKENKTKKIKLTNKRNTVVLRTFKYEITTTVIRRKPIVHCQLPSYNLQKSSISA